MEEIESLVNKLDSCEYNSQVMSQVLDDVQKIVDKLNLGSYTNLSKWVKELSKVKMKYDSWHKEIVGGLAHCWDRTCRTSTIPSLRLMKFCTDIIID